MSAPGEGTMYSAQELKSAAQVVKRRNSKY